MARAGWVALRCGGHVLGAVVYYFYGLAGLPREERRVGGDHRGVFFFAAKAAAGLRLHHANAVFREAKEDGESFVHIVGALERAPDGDALIRVRARDHSLGLDIELLLRSRFVIAFN